MKEMKSSKGKIYFEYTDGKLYSYDINKRVFKNEKTDKVLKSTPPSLKAKIVNYSKEHKKEITNRKKTIFPYDSCVTDYIISKFSEWWIPNLSDILVTNINCGLTTIGMIDMLNSALKSANKKFIVNEVQNSFSYKYTSIINMNRQLFGGFKNFLSELTKSDIEEYTDNFNMLVEQIKENRKANILKKYPLYEELTNPAFCGTYVADNIKNMIDRLEQNLENDSYYSLARHFGINNYMKWFKYYFEKYFKFYFLSIASSGRKQGYSGRDMIYYYEDFLRLCKDLNTKPKCENFFTEYMRAKIEFSAKSDTIINKRIVEHLSRYPLAFENEDLKVIVPTTAQEFIDEANNQGNCIERSYLDGVIRGDYIIVFIRDKKDLTKSYISCEIGKNGAIYQYLAKHNTHPRDDKAIKFKKEYQTYLYNAFKSLA